LENVETISTAASLVDDSDGSDSAASDDLAADALGGGSSDDDSPSSGVSGGGSDTPAANALRENIATKGKNAYYYAHAREADAPVVRRWTLAAHPSKAHTVATPLR
jgi:hypothetical protein